MIFILPLAFLQVQSSVQNWPFKCGRYLPSSFTTVSNKKVTYNKYQGLSPFTKVLPLQWHTLCTYLCLAN
jgi:hypothetical protein